MITTVKAHSKSYVYTHSHHREVGHLVIKVILPIIKYMRTTHHVQLQANIIQLRYVYTAGITFVCAYL